MTKNVLEIHHLTVSLPRGADRSHALTDVSFAIKQGELLCLVGESGSGKSMAAHTVMGLLPGNVRATAGEVFVDGEDLLPATAVRMRQLRGEKLSMIFQEPMTALNPVMTCGAQVEEVLVRHSTSNAVERRKLVLDMLARVRLPDVQRISRSYPHQLSGGQRQRIMIAMATILRPALLIADEPTTALDVTTQAEVLRLIRELQRANNTAVLFITHDFGVVSEIADTVAVLQSGRVVEAGARGDVLKHSTNLYTKMLLAAVPDLKPRKQPTDAGTPVQLQATALTKTFQSGGWFRRTTCIKAVDDVSLSVHKGETLGIVGESGSGKSTVARLAARLIEPTSGEIRLNNDSQHLAFRRRVQIVFQDPYRSLNPRRTVGASIMEALLNFGASSVQARRRVEELMEMVQLSPTAIDRYPHEFSGGQRQRICIARAIAIEPEVLIADEAVSALDVSVQAQVLTMLEELRLRLHLTLIFITHDLRVAAQICNTVAVMRQGRVVEQGPVSHVFNNPQHEYTRALLDAAPGRDFDFAFVR